MKNYFNLLRWKTIRANNFLYLLHSVATIDPWVKRDQSPISKPLYAG